MSHCAAMISRTAVRLPEKTALVCGSRTMSFAQLENDSNRLALGLRELGSEASPILPVLLPRGCDVAVALLAIWKAGLTACVLDAAYPPKRQAAIREQCGTDLLLDEALLDRLRARPAAADTAPLPVPAPEDPALAVFTSGSTGQPKGVLLPHRALSLAVQGNMTLLREDDTVLATASQAFIAIMLELIAPLALGATVHIAPDHIRKDVRLVADYIRQRNISVSSIPPQMAAPFLSMADGSLRCLLTGSERVRRLWSTRTAIVCLYGASETCGPVACFPIDRSYENTPLGKAYAGSRIFLLDADGRPVPPGEVGEICVQGQIAIGYLHLPELTAERFAPAPGITGNENPLFRTGDLGRLRPDGLLEYVQRKDWMLKVRGFRVDPGEIETAMLRAAPLDRAVVTGFEDASGQTRLYACYTAAAPVDAESLRASLAQTLPDYMLPAFMEQVEALPLNANGKIDRNRLAPPDVARLRAAFAAPETDLEKALCHAFAKVLGLERVGLDDDFLHLGGDSVSAMRLQALLPHTGLCAAMLLRERTPRALARCLENGGQLPAPLRLADDRKEWPLTFTERQMAAEQALSPDSVAYNVNLAVRVDGPLDAVRLERALTVMARRHRVLRSFYPLRSDGHVRCLTPDIPEMTVPLERESCAEADVPRRVAERNTPFDLARPPLFRATLFSVGPESHILHLTFHHIIVDGLSVRPLLETLWDAYARDLPPQEAKAIRPDYLDFAVRQTREPVPDTAFFSHMFAGGLPENDMPTRPMRPETLPLPDATGTRTLPFAQVERAARRLGVTPYAILTAALGITLAKYCGSEDVTLGIAMNCRPLVETANMAGMFVNSLPVRLRPVGDLSLHEYVRRTGALLEDVRAHSACPFSTLVPLLSPERSAARAPLFDVLLNYLEEPELPDMTAAGLRLAAFPLPTQALPMDLTLELRRRQGCLHMDLLYATSLYQPEIIEGILEHYGTVLERIRAGEDMPLVEAAELGEAQRRQLLEDFSGGDTDSASGQTVVDAFRAQARLYPERRAAALGDTSISYGELDALTDRLARLLAARGLGRGGVVGILVKRGLMMPVGALGALKCGAAYLPLDPTYPPERLEYMLADSGAALLIAGEGLEENVPGFSGQVLGTEDILTPRDAPPAGTALPPAPRPEDLLTLIYTSGTTGKPKGVMLSHANLDSFCRWYARHYALGPSDVVAAYASFGFDACLMDMFPALTRGACVQIVPEELRLDLPGLNACFEKYGVTLAFMTTQLGRQFAESMSCKSLRVLTVGGESLVPLDPPRGYAFDHAYGPTECTVFTSVFRMERRYDRVPLGRPLDNTRLYILDGRGRLAPVGTAGELCVAGRQVAPGYLNRPDLTVEKFTPNPFSRLPGYERLYHTGDMIRWLPDGTLDFVGRRDFQVKIRGFRVELTEIEGRLRQYADVADAAVVALDAPGGGKCAVAYVVMRDGKNLDEEKLNAFIGEQLPPYMVPAAILAVEAVPLTPNGKVDRKKLPSPDFAATVPDRTANAAVQTESLLTATVREALAQILGHGQFHRTSNLLRAGLTSLSAIRLAALLDGRLGAAPAVRDILADPSPLGVENALTRALLQRGEEARAPLAGAGHAAGAGEEDANAPWPLAHNQLGVYFDCVKRPDTLAYNVPLRLDMPAGVDAARLAGAVSAVVTAHAALHVRLEVRDGRVLAVPLPIQADVPCLPMDEAALATRAAAFARPFDLFAGPLWRAEVIATPGGVSLLWDAHHLVFDGASLDILLRSLDAAYREGRLPPSLREKRAVRDWARDEAAREDGPRWREDKAWLDRMFQDFEGASQIPSDMPPVENAGALAEVARALDGPAMETFRRTHGLTPAALCLAAVSYAVCRWTQGQESWLSAISSGRDDVRLSHTVGMFVRTVPLRVALGEGLSRLDYVRAAHAALGGAVRHEGYPYTRVCEEYGFTPHIMYACELGVTGELRLDGQPVTLRPLTMPEPKFPLSVHVEERGGGPVFAVQYDSARYSAWLMERFADTLVTALSGILAGPLEPLRGLSLISPEQAALLDRFNQTAAPLPEAVLHRIFEAVAARRPGHTALVASEGGYTYARLNAEANRLAHGLLALGVQPEDRVAFVLPRTGRIVIAMLGILKAGCAYIPLDPHYPAERIAHVLEDSGARFILMDSGADVTARLAGMPGLLDMDAVRAGREEHNPDVPVSPEHLAYLIYTSGSTGRPKGVMLRHAGIVNYVTAHERNRHVAALAADAHAMLSVTTVAFDMFLKESMTALCNGLTLVLADDGEARDPVRLAGLFARTGADAFNATPSRLLEYAAHPPLLKALLSCRVLMAGAEKYPDALFKTLRRGQARLFNTYGPTEITVSCNAKELAGDGKVTVGAPLLNVQEYVVDADNNVLPCGMIGELLVGGMGVALGYNNLPEQTAARFVMLGGRRVYRTGDYARWTSDGEIAILGRNDNQVKLRGLRIELGEVENALEALPGVAACVAGIRTINGTEHLCAWYVGGEADPQPLRRQLAAVLPQYMTPTAWMRLTRLPTLPNGKIDTRALPDPESPAARDYVPPVSALERQICAIFATVLERDRVGATDSFFDLGGSSLAVARVLSEADRLHVRDMAYADVFAHPTPRALAACLEARQHGHAGSAPAAPAEKRWNYAAIHDLLARNTLEAFRAGPSRPLGHVLLTGATGFLGAHMLHSLLTHGKDTVCCLLRRGRYASVEKRLKQILYYYFEDTFDGLFGQRLFALEGDITDAATLARVARPPHFRPDTIINCAANVSHFAVGSAISDVNLGGVRHLVDLALRLEARLVQISTASVAGFSIDGTPPPETRLDERHLFVGQSLENAYVRSKFLAEHAILEAVPRGLDAKIMRVGNLMARNRDGEFQINPRANSFIGRLRAWYAVGGFPYASFLHRTELAPIDSTARAVLLLATAPRECRIFHPFNNHSLFMGDIVEAMRQEGLDIPLMEDGEFARALEEARRDGRRAERLISLVAYGNMAGGKTAVPLAAESAYTAQALLRHGWHWPETGGAYLRTFIRGLAGMGFFDM